MQMMSQEKVADFEKQEKIKADERRKEEAAARTGTGALVAGLSVRNRVRVWCSGSDAVP